MTTIRNDAEFVLELITENEALLEFKEASSATTVNPAVTWAKFVLTDDLPNGNNQRVPKEEFENLIKSGVFMPIKMAKGTVEEDHKRSEPVGVITNLKEDIIDDRNVIVGLAALWSRERPEDVMFIKSSTKEGKPPRLSWEILFKNSTFKDGIEELHDVVLRASTIVGRPAYGDRTPILAVAAFGSPAYLDELGDDSFLLLEEVEDSKERKFPFKDRDGNLDKELLASSIEEIENSTLDEKVKQVLLEKANVLLVENKGEQEELQSSTEEIKLDELELLKQELDKARAELDASRADISAKEAALVEKESELAGLREFKASIEEKELKASKLQAIKEKFAAAKIEKDEVYFTDNEEKLLAMKDEDFDFMVQELAAFSNTEKSTSASVPAIVVSGAKTSTNIKEIAEALRSSQK